MKYRLFILGLIAVLFTACAINEEDHSTPAIDTEEEFYATIEDASTRVFVDDQLRVLWNADDRVSIFNRTTFNRQYRFDGRDGANSGTFVKVPNDDFVTSNPLEYVYSVYPYNSNTEISNDGELTVYLPAEQSYREDSFGLGANTMIAVADDNELMFKNLCGYIMLKLYGDDVTVSSISLKGNNNEPLAGKATVNASIDGDPSLSFDSSATKENTLTFDSPVTLGTTAETATTFWLVVPPTTFERGITLTVTTDDDAIFEKSTSGSLAISRNTRATMAALKVVPVPQVHYLTFTSEGTTTLSLSNFNDNAPVLYYSFDRTHWTYWDYSELTFTSEQPLYICGNNPDGFSTKVDNTIRYSTFTSDGSNFQVSGDIMSLIDKDEEVKVLPSAYCLYRLFYQCSGLTTPPALPATTLTERCYVSMFSGCTNLATAPILPATTLASYCYSNIFEGCTSLTIAPELPATALTDYCYNRMFYGCTSLTTAPELPATTLANGCYRYLFYGCTSLTIAPELPATTLANECYRYMFNGCTSLANAPELPAMTLAPYCYNSMFNGCTSLTNAPELPAMTLAPYCYSGMFFRCSSLTIAPELPATTLASYCYNRMFYCCTSLTTVPELSATTLAERCCESMFDGCTSLTSAPKLHATTLASYCYYRMFHCCTSLTTVPELSAITLAERCCESMFDGCTSLTNAPGLPATTLAERCYYGMFAGCSSLTNAPELPATTLAPNCYFSMFGDCTSLTNAPELPATTLAPSCYAGMFSFCVSLPNAPELPATALASCCYRAMFAFCYSLTKAPELPASTLADQCYYNMFSDCTQLNYVKCLATDISAENCVYKWLIGVAATGTFVKAAGMNDWPQGDNGIPEGWTVESCPEEIDLGLPSGIKWASFNLGASSPEEYGDYYAWGEIEPKDDYSWATYKWGDSSTTLTKYCTNSSYGTVDDITELQRQEDEGETMDDAARARLGEKWRMPRVADFVELINNTNTEWTTYNGVNGWKFISKTNAANWIFLPAAGSRVSRSLPDTGSFGYYWSSSLLPEDPSGACYLFFSSGAVNWNYYGNRCHGRSVRPVYCEE